MLPAAPRAQGNIKLCGREKSIIPLVRQLWQPQTVAMAPWAELVLRKQHRGSIPQQTPTCLSQACCCVGAKVWMPRTTRTGCCPFHYAKDAITKPRKSWGSCLLFPGIPVSISCVLFPSLLRLQF